jgi:hypothetical protein
MYGVADSADVGSCLVRTCQQLKQRQRRRTRAIRIADAVPAALAAQMLAQQLPGFGIEQRYEHRVPLHVDSPTYPARRCGGYASNGLAKNESAAETSLLPWRTAWTCTPTNREGESRSDRWPTADSPPSLRRFQLLITSGVSDFCLLCTPSVVELCVPPSARHPAGGRPLLPRRTISVDRDGCGRVRR